MTKELSKGNLEIPFLFWVILNVFSTSFHMKNWDTTLITMQYSKNQKYIEQSLKQFFSQTSDFEFARSLKIQWYLREFDHAKNWPEIWIVWTLKIKVLRTPVLLNRNYLSKYLTLLYLLAYFFLQLIFLKK